MIHQREVLFDSVYCYGVSVFLVVAFECLCRLYLIYAVISYQLSVIHYQLFIISYLFVSSGFHVVDVNVDMCGMPSLDIVMKEERVY